MSYVADYEIPVLRDRLAAGDREAGERLLAYCEWEIPRLAILRERVREGLARIDAERREPLRVGSAVDYGEVVDGELLEIED